MSARIWMRRVYDPPTRNDGCRVLVDAIWPRGMTKADARVDLWLREIAPSTELRRWFGHDPEKWDEFRRRYRAELEDKRDAVDRLVELTHIGRVTLVFGAREARYNNASVVREVVEETRAGQG